MISHQKKPKLISSKSLFKNPFVEIKRDIIAMDARKWDQVYFTKPNKNGAAIIPLDDTGVYLVNQYRHPSQKFYWQIPMGMLDIGHTPLQTARKELLEEMGFTAEEFTQIGSFFAEPGMSNQETFLFVAKGLEKHERQLEYTEIGMEVRHFTFEVLEQMVRQNEIQCGFTLAALFLLKNNYKG